MAEYADDPDPKLWRNCKVLLEITRTSKEYYVHAGRDEGVEEACPCSFFFFSFNASMYLPTTPHVHSCMYLQIPRIDKWRIGPPSTPLRRMASLPAHLVNPVRGMEWNGLNWIPVFLGLNPLRVENWLIVINGVYVVRMYVQCM